MFENIGKKIKRIAIVGGILGTVYASKVGLNNLINNREYIYSNSHSVIKPDGALGYTSFSIYQDGDYREDQVYQDRPCFLGPDLKMSDGGTYGEPDGLVDEIYIEGRMFSGVNGVLTREKNYSRFKSEFDKADRVLAESKERFAEYFK